MFSIVRTILTTAIFASLIGSAPVYADENADWARDGLKVCAASFPNARKTQELLKAEGWRFHGIRQNIRLYTRNGFRVVAGTQAGANAKKMCLVAASKMKPTQAIALAKEQLRHMKNVKPVKDPDGSVVEAWTATVNGVPIMFGVIKSVNFRVMRGAAIAFIEIK